MALHLESISEGKNISAGKSVSKWGEEEAYYSSC